MLHRVLLDDSVEDLIDFHEPFLSIPSLPTPMTKLRR